MRRRRAAQVVSTFLLNPYFPYFTTRVIYQGGAKYLCAPGLNCYACPLAAFSCPIGGLQLAFTNFSYRLKEFAAGFGVLIYVLGSVGLVGSVLGRIPCGWICPFGFLQDLLYKVPLPKWRLPRRATLGPYFFLVVLVALVPFLTGVSWFSRLCPAGTLEGGLFLKAVPPDATLPPAGWFFWLKLALLGGFLAWMMASKRPFCRTVCPLGALFGMCNRISALPHGRGRHQVQRLRGLPPGLPGGHQHLRPPQLAGMHPLPGVRQGLPARRRGVRLQAPLGGLGGLARRPAG